ncbi:MAG: hypothetical protein RIS79_840 [Verrucomicrobiota bacterium]|jgi:RNA polymerase-binding transcription factor DksA
MPAKKSKPAAKKPAAKPATKAPSKPAGKPKSKPSPAKKTSPKPVKKAPAKKAAKPAPKKPAAKPIPKKAAPVKKPAPAKKAVPAKKPAAPVKKAPSPAPKAAPKPVPAPKAPVKAAPAPVKAAPAPVKAAKPASKGTPTPKISSGPKTGTPRRVVEDEGATIEIAKGPVKMTPFLKKQKQRLIELRDAYMSSIEGVSAETIRDGGDSSAFGMHQADAGSDAYDRDFALSLLGKEQDALYEINEALKRIDNGTYGICEGTGEKIMEERLEAMPFARYGIAWQEKIEREGRRNTWNRPVHSLFGLDDGADDDKDDDKDEEESSSNSSNSNNSGESLDFSKE